MNYILYLQIKTWLLNSITEEWSPDITLQLDDDIYACIGYDSSNDIQVNMYSDHDLEDSIDGGGCCEMSDFYEFMEQYDGMSTMSQSSIDVLDNFIKEKSEFLYELCFIG